MKNLEYDKGLDKLQQKQQIFSWKSNFRLQKIWQLKTSEFYDNIVTDIYQNMNI